MKKTTLTVVSLFWLATAAGTFWWGTHHGRELALNESSSEGQRSGIGEPSRLLGESPVSSENQGGVAPSQGGDSDPTESGRPMHEVMTEALALTKEGMMTQSAVLKAYNLVQELEEDELSSALSWVETHAKGQQQQILRMQLLARLAEFDGLSAVDYVMENSRGNQQRMMNLSSVISSWSESDPEAAYLWFTENEESEELEGFGGFGSGRYYLNNVFRGLSLKDVDNAFAKMELLENEQDRSFAISGMMSGASDPERRAQLLEKLQGFEDQNLKNQGYQMLISQWANYDPEEAADFLENTDQIEASTIEMLTNSVGSAWMQVDPEKGAEWLVETATDESRSSRINQAISNWVYQDPNDAARWLAEFEPSPEIDDALRSLSMGIIQRDGEASFEWAARITDENKRRESLQLVFQQWYNQDAEQAEAHLRSSNVAPEQKEEWLKQVKSVRERPNAVDILDASASFEIR